MIFVENKMEIADNVSISLSQDEAWQLIKDLQRAKEEAKDHETIFPITMLPRGGYQKERLVITVESK